MYRVNYYVLWTLAMMVCKDYGCDDLYGLLLWWSIWIVDVNFYLYVYELLFYADALLDSPRSCMRERPPMPDGITLCCVCVSTVADPKFEYRGVYFSFFLFSLIFFFFLLFFFLHLIHGQKMLERGFGEGASCDACPPRWIRPCVSMRWRE